MAPASTYISVFGDEFEYAFSVLVRYGYRLDPRPRHRAALARAFGRTRVVYNDGLRIREQEHHAGLPHRTHAQLSARLTAVKKSPERAWLNEALV